MIRPKLFSINLDLKNRNYITDIIVSQGDQLSNVFRFNLVQDSLPYDLTSLSVKTYFERPDKFTSFITGQLVDAAKGIVDVELTNQILNTPGVATCQVMIIGTENELLSSLKLIFAVEKSINYSSIESTNEYNALVDALSNVQSIRNEFEIVIANVTVDSEVILARGGNTTLKERLDNVDAQLAEIEYINQIKEFENRIADELIDDIDYVKLINSKSLKNLKAKILGEKSISILTEFKTDKYAVHDLFTDADSLIRIGSLSVADGFSQSLGIYENYKSENLVGSWSTTAPNAHFTMEVGATLQHVITGTGIQFIHYADNRGGVFKVEVDGVFIKNISTYNSTALAPQYVEIIKGLEYGQHTIKLTFLGDDPENVPSSGAGTARGWVWYNASGVMTFRNYIRSLNTTEIIESNSSNREFAIQFRKVGTTDAYKFVPSHNSEPGVSQIKSQKILVDNKEIIDWTAWGDWETVESIKIVQMCDITYPTDTLTKLGEYMMIIEFSGEGVKVNGEIMYETGVEISVGYTSMLPVKSAFGNALVTSKGVRYPTTLSDNTFTNLALPVKSVAFFNTAKDYVYAMTVNYMQNTYRLNDMSPSNVNSIQHRSDGIQKFYSKTYINHFPKPGELLRFSANYTLGEIANANTVLPS